MVKDLNEYIERARHLGKTSDEIKQSLLKAGWTKAELDNYWPNEEALVVPVPPSRRTSARDLFFYLLNFFSLALLAFSLGRVWFSLINFYFTDQVVQYWNNQLAGLGWGLAASLVTAPIFIFVSWRIERDIKIGLSRADSKVRKILGYLAIFIASAVVIGDIIGLLSEFLSGQINTRFIAKVIVILLIGLWIIGYYWFKFKSDETGVKNESTKKTWFNEIHLVLLVVVTVLSLVLGFVLQGNPYDRQKSIRDQERRDGLVQISQAVSDYYNTEKKLPNSLADVYQGNLMVIPKDPMDESLYQYTKVSDSEYKLCATFEAEYDDQNSPYSTSPIKPYDSSAVIWWHPAGEYCYNLKAKLVDNSKLVPINVK